MKLEDLQILNVEDFLGKYLDIAGVSRGFASARCPYHDDERASFSINLSSGRWQCRGCATKGKFLALAERLKIPHFKPILTHAYTYKDIRQNPSFVVLRYFPKTFKQFRIDPEGNLVLGGGRLPELLYRLPELVRSLRDKPVYLVEGEKDVETLRALGYVATTCAGGASSWCEDHGKQLVGRRVIAIPDNDDAGTSWCAKVRSTTQLYGILSLPEGVKDVTEWIEQGHKIESLPLEKISEVYVDPMGELFSGFDVLSSNQTFPPIIHCGIPGLDAAGVFREGGIVAIGGRPSMGKSSLVAQIASHIAKKHKCLVLPYEEDSDTFLRRIFVQDGLLENIDGDLDIERVKQDAPQVQNLFFMEENPTHIFKLRERLEKVLEKHEIKVLILDHLQELHAGSAPSMHHAITVILQVLKELKEKYKLTLIMALQLKRAMPGERPRMPVMSDARESGTIEGICHGMIMMHRPNYYDPNESNHVFLGIQKNRYGKRNISVRLLWNETKMKCEEPEAFASWD